MILMLLLVFVLLKIDRLAYFEPSSLVKKKETRDGGSGIDLNDEATRLAPLTPVSVGPAAL